MEVSFDGLRKRLIADYNSLTNKLNEKIGGAEFDPCILMFPDEIQREMDGIRSCIVTLAFLYQKGEDGFECLDENTHFERFNEKPELS